MPPLARGRRSTLPRRRRVTQCAGRSTARAAHQDRARGRHRRRAPWRARARLAGPTAGQASQHSTPAARGLTQASEGWSQQAAHTARARAHEGGRHRRRVPRKRKLTLRGAQNRAVQPGSMCSSAGWDARVRGIVPASCGFRARRSAIRRWLVQSGGARRCRQTFVRLSPAQLRQEVLS